MSISNALLAADAIREELNRGRSDPRNLARTPDEILDGHNAKLKVQESLASTIATVQNTLNLFETTPSKSSATTTDKFSPPTSLNDHHAVQLATCNLVVTSDPTTNPQNLVNSMSADNMKAGTQSLQQMATAIEPIVDKFDSILTAPYLNQYSATLNTVPIVGVKNNQLLYVQTKSQLTGIIDVWSTFSSLPSGATITEGDVVHIFPYKGDFCFAIGKTVWKKVHLNSQDPAIQNAVDNWSALYSQDWTVMGECLPAPNLAGIVPFSVLSADRSQIAFNLVTLAVDGTLSWLTSDQLNAQSEWQALTYQVVSGGPSTSPNFTKIAYWNNTVVGIDDASNSWNVNVSFQNGTYSIADSAPIEPVTEFTATDVGLVGLRADGYLWKRTIAPSPDDDSSKDPVLQWEKWIQADGVVNIGVASPGVILDMNLLTRTMKSRYLEVQTSIYPAVENIQAFCTTHEIFLNNLAEAAQDFNAAGDDTAKQSLAIQNGRAFVTHAKMWSSIVSQSVNSCQGTVTTMTDLLNGVQTDLNQQLAVLNTKLAMLQATLQQEEDQMSTLKAAFWGSIGAMFLGLVIEVIGCATGCVPALIAGGVLMAGGLIAASVLGSQMSKLAGDIATASDQIDTVTIAITEIKAIVDAFGNLHDMYHTLNGFWGGLVNDSSNINSMDSSIALEIGYNTLADPSSIQASLQTTTDMGAACQTYLNALNRQGVVLPVDTPSFLTVDTPSTSTKSTNATSPPTIFQTATVTAPLSGSLLGSVFKLAQDTLREGTDQDYHKVMSQAILVCMSESVTTQFIASDAGFWFDLPTLHSTSNIWMSPSQNFRQTAGVVSFVNMESSATSNDVNAAANSLDASLDEARTSVTQVLQSILDMGNTMVTWSQEFPELPTDPADVEKLTLHQANAVKACQAATSQAATANNSFADFNHQATTYQQNLASQINEKNDKITAANAQVDESFDRLRTSPGFALADDYTEMEDFLSDDEDNSKTVDALNAQIQQLKSLESSGTLFNGHVMSWSKMVETVSGNLGCVHNVLVGVGGELREDPITYRQFIQQQWNRLVQNANEVLAILNNSTAPVALWAVPRETALVASLAVYPVVQPVLVAVPSPSPIQRVVAAVSPSDQLGDIIASQATQAATFFTALDILLGLPLMKDVIGYWDKDKTQKHTLYDIVVSLRSDYTNMIGLEYNAVHKLQSLALQQDFRAGNVLNGRLPVKTFIQSTLTSIRAAVTSSNTVNNKFKDSANAFTTLLETITTNIATVEQQLSDLDDKIGEAEKAKRDKVISVIANSFALVFANAAVLTSFGIVGSAAAALGVAVKTGAGASLVDSSVTTVLNGFSLDDLVRLTKSLKANRTALQESMNQLKTIQPLFADVVTGVFTLNATIQNMQDVLVDIQSDVNWEEGISFTQEDVEGVQIAWKKIREDTQMWLETINRQGIVPQWAS